MPHIRNHSHPETKTPDTHAYRHSDAETGTKIKGSVRISKFGGKKKKGWEVQVQHRMIFQ